MINHTRKFDFNCLAWRKKYRSYFEIIASILEAIKNGVTVKCSLMKYIGTNSMQLKKYLECLIQMGLVEVDIKNGQIFYKISEKGLEFLRQYYVLLSILLGASNRKSIALPSV